MLSSPQNLQMDFVPAGRCCHHRYRSLVGGIISGVYPKIQKFSGENTEYTWDALSTLDIRCLPRDSSQRYGPLKPFSVPNFEDRYPTSDHPTVNSTVMTDKKHGDLW